MYQISHLCLPRSMFSLIESNQRIHLQSSELKKIKHSFTPCAFFASLCAIMWRMQTKAAFKLLNSESDLKSCCQPWQTFLALVWVQTSQMENLKCCNCVTQSAEDSSGALVMWREPSALLSAPLSSSRLCQTYLPLSASCACLLIFLPSLIFPFSAYKWYHFTSLPHLPPWPSLHLSSLFIITLPSSKLAVHSHISPSLILLNLNSPPRLLFYFSAISSLCYSGPGCSLDQYSAPILLASGSSALNPSPSLGWAQAFGLSQGSTLLPSHRPHASKSQAEISCSKPLGCDSWPIRSCAPVLLTNQTFF